MLRIHRVFTAAFALIGASVLSATAVAQGKYPSRPVNVIVGLAAGSAIDLTVRILADRVGPKLGQPLVVENVIGSNAILPGLRLAKAEPNGYTLGVYTNAIQTILPHMGQKLQFDPIKDFVPVTMLGFLPSLLIVNADLPAKSLPELIALAKASPGKLNYGSAGFGSWQHLAMELLRQETGVNLTHVPYRSAAQAVQATATGDVNAFWTPIAVARPFIQAGKVRALALGESERSPEVPEIPALAEVGLKGTSGYSVWSAIYAPAGTPPDVIAQLRGELQEAMKDPALRKRIADVGLVVRFEYGEEFMRKVHAEGQQMAEIIKRLGGPPPQ